MEGENTAARRLSKEDRQCLIEALLASSQDGKMHQGLLTSISVEFSISTRTISRYWKDIKTSMAAGTVTDPTPKTHGAVGRKRVHMDLGKIAQLPLRKRTTIRSLATALGMAKTTVHRRVKEGELRAHTSAIKPYLHAQNKKTRVQFCLSMLHIDRTPDLNRFPQDPIFHHMFDIIHIDEKWFYLTKTTERYYLLPQETDPVRCCQSKRFIPKIMFLGVVARPRCDPMTGAVFSGKIGIFPFTQQEPAKRSSKNRAAGSMETKSILVTRDVTRTWLIEKVLPAIRSKWPTYGSKTIYVQQDNAKPHIQPNDQEFNEAASKDGFDIRLICQPPNSPDMNVLDLGFFRAIQSLQQQKTCNTIDELIIAVETAFDEFCEEKLNHCFLSWQMCMVETLRSHGDNSYKLPHMGKQRLVNQGELPLQLSCPQEIVDDVLNSM